MLNMNCQRLSLVMCENFPAGPVVPAARLPGETKALTLAHQNLFFAV